MTKKVYLSANELLKDSFLLARKVYDSEFFPDIIIALWRGGSPVGMAVHEFFTYMGKECYSSIVKTTSYTGIGECCEPVVENMDFLATKINEGTKVLIVDDVFDTGGTAAVMKKKLIPTMCELRFAMPYFKPQRNKTDFVPDFFVKEIDDWVVFPHELCGLTDDELIEKDEFFSKLCSKN